VGVWTFPSVIVRFSRIFGGRVESWLRRWEGRRATNWVRYGRLVDPPSGDVIECGEGGGGQGD